MRALILSVLVIASSASVSAAEPPSFKDKKIEISVGYGAGGGPDMATRIVARHLGRFVPGNPTLIVMNRPGAESLAQANYVFSVAPSDGLAIGYVGRAAAIHQIANRPGVRFDMAKFQWFGGFAQQNTVVFIRRDMKLNSIEEMKRATKPVIFAVRAPGGTDFLSAKALEALGVPVKIVAGYGSGQTTMAFERWEIDASALTLSAFKQRADWVKPGGLAISVVEFGSVPSNEVPIGPNLTPMPEKAGVYSLINKALALPVGTFAGPPGMSPEITAVYDKAFSEMAKDPTFLDDAKKGDIEVNPIVSGKNLQALYADFLEAPAAAKKEFAALSESE